MKRISLYILVAVIALVSVPADATVRTESAAKGKPARTVNCDQEAGGCLRDLVAGQNLVVGTVGVDVSGEALVVTYEITDLEWWITEIHFNVSDTEEGITATSAPGQFAFKPSLDGPTQFFQFELEGYAVPADGCYYYAAHAVVARAENATPAPDLSDPDALNLPETVQMSVIYKGNESSASNYFEITIDDPLLGGTYDAWCVDVGHGLGNGEYTAAVFSSYESLPEELSPHIDHPENLPMVNYVLNTYQPDGFFTACDIQKALWAIIDDEDFPCEFFNQDHVDLIVDDANTNGQYFEPGCGDLVALLLVVLDDTGAVAGAQLIVADAQVTTIVVPTTCDPDLVFTGEEETAWGCGPFIDDKKSWAMYFSCCVEPPEPPPALTCEEWTVKYREFLEQYPQPQDCSACEIN
jgi:hypothetical protein